jgi:hypothetical protein
MATVTGNQVVFDSLADCARWLESTPPADGAGAQSHDTGHRPSQSWDLGLGYAGAIEYASGGKVWADGLAMIRKGTANATAQREVAQAAVLGNDIAGFMPDVPAYLAGQPDCMIAYGIEETKAPKPVISIALAGFSFGMEAQDMVNRGVAVLSLVDALESDGQRCEVWFASSIVSNEGAHMHLRVKAADQHWNPGAAAFALAHPGLFRRLWFATMERFEGVNGSTNGGYGTCRLVDQQDAAPYTLAYPYTTDADDWRTLDSALRRVQSDANALGLGVKLIEEKA